MRKITDEEMREKYKDIEDSVTALVRNREEAFYIIWFDIAKIIGISAIQCKLDMYGSLMVLLTGTNKMGNVLYGAFEQQTDIYRGIVRKYAYGKSVNDLGVFWQELLMEEKMFRLRLLQTYLSEYEKTLIPFIHNKVILENEKWVEPKDTKIWRKHLGSIKSTKRIIGVVLDIQSLRYDIQNDV